MDFEWDPGKSKTNYEKHDIDFNTAKAIWNDPDRIIIKAPYPLESRYIIIGQLQGKTWTGIYTMRDYAIRIISVRRSRKKEEVLYGYEKNRKKQ